MKHEKILFLEQKKPSFFQNGFIIITGQRTLYNLLFTAHEPKQVQAKIHRP